MPAFFTAHAALFALIAWKICDFVVNQVHPNVYVTSVLNWFIPILRAKSGEQA
jgi:hypothetical protein